jgi:hypothetical protein
VSVVAGQVVQLSVTAMSPTGGAVTPLPTFTFNSSNTTVATVSPVGLVCGGVWDALFIVCNGLDNSGNPIAGSAALTASAQGVTSVPVQVTVHPVVNSIVVDAVNVPGGCFSAKTTHQFTAHACSPALPHDSAGPCSPNGREITSLVGPLSWTSLAPNVGAVDANGLATANVPGLAGIIASVGSVTSAATNFRSCMPVQITLHINGDPAGQPTESASLTVGTTTAPTTQTVEADMVDELGVTTNSAPVTISNNNSTVAALAGTTLTAQSNGGATLVASCVPPTCGQGLNLPVYSNPFRVTVSGANPQPMVFATTSFAPPSGTTPTLIPIDTSKNPIVAGTAINLPGTPNSMIFAPSGARAFLGTSAGIASLDVATSTVSLLDPFVGKALAVSPDGTTVIFSNATIDPQPAAPAQRLVILNTTNNTVQSFVLPGALAASFTSDGFKAFIAASNGNVYVFSPFLTLQTLTTLGGTNTDVVTLPSASYAYFANSGGLGVIGTCNNAQPVPPPPLPTVNSNTVTLLGATRNANLIVALESTGVNIETATVAPLTTTFPFVLTQANCAPPTNYSNAFIDFAQGPFTAHQLLVPTNGTGGGNGSHIVVLPAGTPNLFVAVPGGSAEIIPLTEAGATEPVSGGLMLDGNTAWVGVAGSNTVDQIVLTNSPATADVLQIKTSFVKGLDGTPAPPNIVVVQPK